MDTMKKVPLKITPDLKKHIKRGAQDAHKFLASTAGARFRTYAKRKMADAREMYPRNKRLDTARVELMLTFEAGWRAGLRFFIVECARSSERQKKLNDKGASQLSGKGKQISQHNYDPSRACDFVPINKKGKGMWYPSKISKDEDTRRLNNYAYSIGFLRATAASLKLLNDWKVSFRSGRDWKCTSTVTAPTSLADWAHIALRDDAKGCEEDEKIFGAWQDS